MNDFQIIIGANTSNIESDIISTLNSISKNYPLKLNLEIGNTTELQKILSVFDKVGNTNLSKSFEDVVKSTKKATDEAKKYLKVTDKINAETKKPISKTVTSDDGVRVVKNVFKPNEEGNMVLKTVEKTVNYKKQISEEEKLQVKLNKEIESWGDKINSLEREGYTHHTQLTSLKTKLNKLTEEEINDTNKLNKLLEEMNAQYKKAKDYQTKTKDRVGNVKKVDEASSKLAKVDTSLLDENGLKEYAKMQEKISKLDNFKNLETQSRLITEINKHYKSLLDAQEKGIQKQKLQLQQEKERSEIHRHLAEMEKQQVKAPNANIDLKAQDTQRLIDEMANGRENSEKRRKIDDKQHELNQMKAIQAEQQRQYQNQVKIHEATKEFEKTIARIASKDLFDEQDLSQARQMISRLAVDSNNLESELKGVRNEFKRISSELKSRQKELERNIQSIQQLGDKLESHQYRATRGLNNDPRTLRQTQAMYGDVRNQYDELQRMNPRDANFNDRYNEIIRSLANADRQASDLRNSIQRSQNSVFGRIAYSMKQVPIWMGAMSLFYGSMMQVKQGFQSILEIDKSMINLQKVTEATNAELDKFKNISAEIGSQMGVTTAQVINSTTEFQKLGYSLQESTALARNSILYANVGDMEIEDATSYIVSSIKGFNVEVDKSGQSVQNLIDMFNEVSNNFAITSAGIGEALQRSSAVLTQAGNSVEQSVALITSANTTIQNPTKVGNALKTISMRLRGVDEDGSAVVGLMPELEKTFNSFGASIMENETTFKTTYDIMQTLHDNWDKLTDLEQANLTELIGGKEQGSIVASMIANWEDAEGALESAMNSSGSALREFENYTEGFEYKINRLKVALEKFWMSLINDETFKGLIDGLTGAVDVATKLVETFGSLPVLISTLVPLIFTVSSTMRGMLISKEEIGEAKTALTDFWKSNNKNAESAKKAFKGFSGVVFNFAKRLILITGAILAVSWAISKVIDIVTYKSKQREETIQRMEDEITKYEELQDRMDSLDFSRLDELNNIKDNQGLNLEERQELIELNNEIAESMPELVASYDAEGNAIIKTNEEIKEYLELKRQQNAENMKVLAENKVEDADYSDLEDKIEDINKYKKMLDYSNEENIAYNYIQSFIKENVELIESGGSELDKALNDLYKKIDKNLSDGNNQKFSVMDDIRNMFSDIANNNDLDNASDLIAKKINYSIDRTANLKLELDRTKQEVATYATEFTNDINAQFEAILLNEGIEPKSNKFLMVQNLKDYIVNNIDELGNDPDLKKTILEDFPNMIEEMFNAMDSIDINSNDLLDVSLDASVLESNFKRLSSGFDKNTSSGKMMISMLGQLKNSILKTAMTATANEINPFNGFEKEVIPLMDNFMDEISQLDSSYRQLAEGQQLSLSQIFDLVKAYPELSKQLEYQNGSLTLNKKALMELSKIKEQEFKQDLKIKKQQAQEAIKKAKIAVQSILLEAKAIKTLEDINTKVMKQEIDNNNAKVESSREHLRFAQMVGEQEYANKILNENAKIISSNNKLKESYNTVVGLEDEISIIESLLNTDYSSSLGSITNNKESKEKEKELTDMIYVVDQYEKTLSKLNSQISILSTQREKLEIGSSAYINNLNEEVALHKKKKQAIDAEVESLRKQINTRKIEQKGLITLSDDDNKTARAKQAELSSQIDELQKELDNLLSESESVNDTIKDFRMMYIEANVENFNRQRDEISDDIAYFEYMITLYEEGSEGFKKYSNEKLKYLKQSQSLWQAELDYLEKQKESNSSLTYHDILQVNEAIREARKNLYSINEQVLSSQHETQRVEVDIKFESFGNGIDKFADEIEELEDSLDKLDDDDFSGRVESQTKIAQAYKGQSDYIKDVISELGKMKENARGNHELVSSITDEIEKWEKELKKANKDFSKSKDSIKKIYEELADEIVEIHKESIEHQIDALKKQHENVMDNAEKEHEVKMKQYNKELEVLSKIYDKQIEMINREDETRTYDKTLEKLRKETEKLQAEIDKWSLDTSFESITKQNELREELAKKQEELDDLQYEREKQLRIDSLEDARDTETEKLENARDIYEEQYNKFVENQEKMNEMQIKKLEEQLKNEAFYAQMRLSIIQGNLTQTAKDMEIWQKEVGSYVSELGSVVVENFTKKVTDAIREFKELDKVAKSSNVNSGTKVTTVQKETQSSNDKINQQKDTGSLNGSSGNKAGDVTGGNTSTGGSSGSGSSTSGSYSAYNPIKIVTAQVETTLYSQPKKDNSGKIRQLAKGSAWKAHGEQNGMYDLGGGWADKSSFKVSGVDSQGTSQQSTRYHTVTQGDTMSELAQKYYGKSTEWNKIKNANPNVNPNKMQIGTKLLIPFDTGGYTGDWSGDEGKIALLHKKELVLKDTQTEHLLETIKTLDKLQKVKVSGRTKIERDEPVIKQETIEHYHLTVQVDKLTTNKREVDLVGEQLIKNMKKKKGGRF